jgi:hypothetical protein
MELTYSFPSLQRSTAEHRFLTEGLDRVVNTPASYSGGPGSKSRREDWLSGMRFFVVFLSPSRQMLGCHLKLEQRAFFQILSNLLVFIREKLLVQPGRWVKDNFREQTLQDWQPTTSRGIVSSAVGPIKITHALSRQLCCSDDERHFCIACLRSLSV